MCRAAILGKDDCNMTVPCNDLQQAIEALPVRCLGTKKKRSVKSKGKCKWQGTAGQWRQHMANVHCIAQEHHPVAANPDLGDESFVAWITHEMAKNT
jgi:hypothetical protein